MQSEFEKFRAKHACTAVVPAYCGSQQERDIQLEAWDAALDAVEASFDALYERLGWNEYRLLALGIAGSLRPPPSQPSERGTGGGV